jgi:tagaturonate reductase
LIEKNAERLRELVLQQAAVWKSSPALVDWIGRACSWRSTLVDRIVSSPLPDEPLAADPLSAVAEPFALWAVERAAGSPEPSSKLNGLLRHPAVQQVERLEPYHLRKVRILNGAHTALVAKAMPMGIQTVREALETPEVRAWLERLLFDEIVPVLEGRTDDPAGFAQQTLERFANPFLAHRLSDIALHHAVKLQTRLAPTLADFRQRFGRSPEILTQILEGGK